MVAIKNHAPNPDDQDNLLDVQVLSPEEGIEYFDQRARQLVGLSGEEFLRQWDAGTYKATLGSDGEDRKLNRLIMLLPFAGRSYA
jgi:hypothetical protein